jgi:hypothetical protein
VVAGKWGDEKEKMNNLFIIKNIKGYFLVYRLARKQGVRPGASMQLQFDIVYRKYPEYFEYLGKSEQDIDMISGNLRENGFKVKNLIEEQRKKELG